MDKPDIMEIIILGAGCNKCDNLYNSVLKIVKESGLNADVVHQKNIMEIIKYDIPITPAIVVNGQVKLMGYVPSESEIREILEL